MGAEYINSPEIKNEDNNNEIPCYTPLNPFPQPDINLERVLLPEEDFDQDYITMRISQILLKKNQMNQVV